MPSIIPDVITQAISDFDGIKGAIIEKGVEVPTSTATSEYAEKILEIQSGAGQLLGITGEIPISVKLNENVQPGDPIVGMREDVLYSTIFDLDQTQIGNGTKVAFSHDNKYLSIGNIPYIYKNNFDGTWTRLINPLDVEPYWGVTSNNDMTFSPDGKWFVLSQASTNPAYQPQLMIYLVNSTNDTFTLLTGLDYPTWFFPTAYQYNRIQFTPNSQFFVAISQNTSNTIAVYRITGNKWETVWYITDLFDAGIYTDFSISPDGKILAVVKQISGVGSTLEWYRINYDLGPDLEGVVIYFLTKLPNPSVMPAGPNVYSVAFSGPHKYMAVGYSGGVLLYNYDSTPMAETLTNLPNSAEITSFLGGAIPNSLDFTTNGNYLGMSRTSGNPTFAVFKMIGQKMLVFPLHNVSTSTNIFGIRFSPDMNWICAGVSNTNIGYLLHRDLLINVLDNNVANLAMCDFAGYTMEEAEIGQTKNISAIWY